jgi:hypothetical protein
MLCHGATGMSTGFQNRSSRLRCSESPQPAHLTESGLSSIGLVMVHRCRDFFEVGAA